LNRKTSLRTAGPGPAIAPVESLTQLPDDDSVLSESTFIAIAPGKARALIDATPARTIRVTLVGPFAAIGLGRRPLADFRG
jgi:hypothetical protein